MGLKNLLFKKLIGGGNIIQGHIIDAIIRKKRTGKPFRDCLRESLSETVSDIGDAMVKKTICFILIAMLTSCVVNKQGVNEGKDERTVVSEERHLCGGYTTFRALDEDELRLFGETYKGELALEPFEVATQVVAGTNYRFRCRCADAKSVYLVTIYQPLPGQGEAEVTATEKEK